VAIIYRLLFVPKLCANKKREALSFAQSLELDGGTEAIRTSDLVTESTDITVILLTYKSVANLSSGIEIQIEG
jgi:hypothetical protein